MRAAYVYIVGRAKDMIRRAGENIAANEIEAVVAALDGIAEVAAVPVPDDMRGEEVKIYVVLQDGLAADQLSPEAIIAHCGKNLASFKVPRYIEYRDAPASAYGIGQDRKARIDFGEAEPLCRKLGSRGTQLAVADHSRLGGQTSFKLRLYRVGRGLRAGDARATLPRGVPIDLLLQ